MVHKLPKPEGSARGWGLFICIYTCITLKLVLYKLLCPLSTALSLAVENLRGVSTTPETSQAFITNLGFSTEEFHSIPTELLSICKLWMDKRSTCYMEELVEALVHTQGLGRYTTRLCNHRKCSDWLNGFGSVILLETLYSKPNLLYKQSVLYW